MMQESDSLGKPSPSQAWPVARDQGRGIMSGEGAGKKDRMAEPLLHIVLYQPEIPHNAGAVGRTCVAVGAKLWLVRPLGFRISDRHLRRAGLDYWKHLDWEVVDDWDALLARLPGKKPWMMTKTAKTSYTEVRIQPGDALVFGSESQGLPRWLIEAAPDRCLRVPMRPEARSLNLSVSVGIVTYESLRQWGGGKERPQE